MRKIFGFALLALAAWLMLKLVFGLLGTLVGLAITGLILAALGYLVYLLLRVVAPRTADRVGNAILGMETKLSETAPLTTEPTPPEGPDKAPR